MHTTGRDCTHSNRNGRWATVIHEQACRFDDTINRETPRSKFHGCEGTNASGTNHSNCNGLSATEVREPAGRNASDPRRNQPSVNNFMPACAHSNCNGLSATEVRKQACRLEYKINRQHTTQPTASTTNHPPPRLNCEFLLHAPRPVCPRTATKVHSDNRGLTQNCMSCLCMKWPHAHSKQQDHVIWHT